MKQTLLGLAGAGALLLAISACTNDDVIATQEAVASSSLKEISVSIQQFGADTRLAATVGSDKVSFAWQEGDAIGVFPESGNQAKFTNDGASKFKGEGLAASSAYTAYYPYAADAASANAVPVSYAGQKQTGDNSTTHVGAYDYMASAATAPADGKLSLALKHLGCLVQLTVTMPADGDLTSVALSGVATTGTVDLTAAAPAIAAGEAGTLTLEVSGVTAQKDDAVTLYLMLPPTDLTSDITATLTVGGATTDATISAGKNLEAGKAYKLTAVNPAEEEPSIELADNEVLGTMYYNADWDDTITSYDSSAKVILAKNADGSYTLKDAFPGVPEITFTVEGDVATIVNAGYENSFYKYFYIGSNYVIYCDGDWGYADVTDDYITVYFYRYAYGDYKAGYDYFTWTKPSAR